VFTLKEGVEDEELFLIDHSVFARYECEQLPHRSTMIFKGFELDVGWSKLFRVCKSDEAELSRVKMKLWEHFQRISNIWLYEIGRSDNAKIGWGDFTSWCKRMELIDPDTIDLATFDRTFILTNVNSHGFFSSADRNLNRYEFIEILVRFAKIRYIEKGKEADRVKTAVEAIDKLFNEKIYPNAKSCDGWQWRQKEVYNVKCNEFLRKNMN
jgi:hypothetical protein